MSMKSAVFQRLSGATSEAQPGEAENFLRHAGALGLTKSADGLFDPKLVLSWLLTALSVPAFFLSGCWCRSARVGRCCRNCSLPGAFTR